MYIKQVGLKVCVIKETKENVNSGIFMSGVRVISDGIHGGVYFKMYIEL